jgi:hypothetical protein
MKQIKKRRLLFLSMGLILFLTFYYSHSSVNRLQQTYINDAQLANRLEDNHRFADFEVGKIVNDKDIQNKDTQLAKQQPRPEITTKRNDSFIFDIESARINRLFKILHRKEKLHSKVLNQLQLISFEDIIQKKSKVKYNKLQVNGDEVQVTEEFVNELKQQSILHSFTAESRKNVKKEKITNGNLKPVIVMAANSAYYGALQTTVYKVHQYFPDYHLIIYDLGLDVSQLLKTKEKCKCDVRKFNLNGQYSEEHPHVTNLKKFSWKPIIIQVF